MTRIVFRDFDQFADAIGGVVGRFVPTARPTEEWWVQSVATGRVLTQTVQVGGQVTFAGDGKRDEIALKIPLAAPAMIRVDGELLEQASFLLIKEGHPFTLSTLQATRWVAVVVPSDHELLAPEFVEILTSRLFYERTTARTDMKVEHLNGIRQLAARLLAAADSISLDAAAVRYAEKEIIAIASRALEASYKPQSRSIGRPQFSRARALSRTLALIEANTGSPLFLDDLCRATGLRERTLRNIFHDYFGVGPMRFLKVRQLREIRAALLAADPAHHTVTDIATRFGIWDFSLFARNYKALFGEPPSHTLRATRAQHGFPVGDSWLHYAARVFSREACGAV